MWFTQRPCSTLPSDENASDIVRRLGCVDDDMPGKKLRVALGVAIEKFSVQKAPKEIYFAPLR